MLFDVVSHYLLLFVVCRCFSVLFINPCLLLFINRHFLLFVVVFVCLCFYFGVACHLSLYVIFSCLLFVVVCRLLRHLQ